MNTTGGGHVIVGATSEIGRAVAIEIARLFGRVIVAGRDQSELAIVAEDVRIRTGAAVVALPWEATEFDQHQKFLDDCVAAFGSVDGVVVCHGFMADQEEAAHNWSLTRQMIDVNFSAAVSLINRFADYFTNPAHSPGERNRQYICGISSVAGDRGRQSNYIYGATKAALSTYLAGLRNRLHRSGVAVITVKPGFVDTAMTWGRVNPDSPLVARPERVGRDIARAIRKRRNVVYSPWFWAFIMLIIRWIPEPIFKRLKL